MQLNNAGHDRGCIINVVQYVELIHRKLKTADSWPGRVGQHDTKAARHRGSCSCAQDGRGGTRAGLAVPAAPPASAAALPAAAGALPAAAPPATLSAASSPLAATAAAVQINQSMPRAIATHHTG